jgi:hypothetical protein
VVLSTATAGLMGTTKGDAGTSEDQRSRFWAIAGGGLASATAAAGVATSAVQQLRFCECV